MPLSTYQWRLKDGPSAPWGAWVTSTTEFETNSAALYRTGTKCPKFRELQKAGAILPVNYYKRDSILSEREGCSGNIFWYTGGSSSYQYGQEQWTNYYDSSWISESTWALPFPAFDEGLLAAAVNDAVAEASASATMLPVSIIEARSTLEMLKNAVKRLLKFAEFIRQLSIRRKESFSALWLEYRLGWMPFYYELIGFIETVNGALKEGDRQSGSGVRNDSDSDSQTSSVDIYPYLYQETSESYSVEYRCRGFALGTVTSSVTARYGLNPVTVVWELITLSWLLDKFISVGSWLASVSNGLSGFAVSATGVTLKTRIIRSKSVRRSARMVGTGGGFGDTGWMSLTLSQDIMVRSPASGGSFPSFNTRLSLVSIVDILALIAQFRRWRI